MSRSLRPEVIAAARDLALREALAKLELRVNLDRDFRPTKNALTQRWIVDLPKGTAELLVTGAQWFDTRARVGGGGAIDLAMHLLGMPFITAVRALAKESRSPPSH